jgi:hypothetical protein
VKPRYFPPYTTVDLPVRERADFGPKGDHTWQAYGAGGGGGVRVGVFEQVINSDGTFIPAYGAVQFSTGHSNQKYLGYMYASANYNTTDSTWYGATGIAPPVMDNTAESYWKVRPYFFQGTYDNNSPGQAYSAFYIADNDTTRTDSANSVRVGHYVNRANDAGNNDEWVTCYGDAWHWYGVTGGSWPNDSNPHTSTSRVAVASIYSNGNMSITGNMSKGSGSFDIEHPVLEDKRLRHSFIEGPYADLIYRGTVTLGAEPVTICMDEQFGMAEGTWKALNTNPWSMVSASGKLVEWSLNECELTVTGDEGTVCQWMVIGERKDQHMIDTDTTDNDGRMVLEYTPTATPEDIHDQPIVTQDFEFD